MRPVPGNDLILGTLAGSGTTLTFPRTARDKHLYVCGGTGTGKSKFLESLVRQDISKWQRSRCGMLILDPHGSLYDSIVRWLSWHKIDRPIVPIDLRQTDHIISYNLLRQRSSDPAVLVDSLVDAMAHVWGAGGTYATPRFARRAGNILRPLHEKGLTLLEAEYLTDRVEPVRNWVLEANSGEKMLSAENLGEMKAFLQKVGLNRVFRDQTLTVSLVKPWDSLAQTVASSFGDNEFPHGNTKWWRWRELNPRAPDLRAPRLPCIVWL